MKLSEKSRRKISQANKGKLKPPRTTEHLRKLSEVKRGPRNPNSGKKFSEQTKQKMRDAHAHAHNGRRKSRVPWNKDKPLSPEHRKRIVEANWGNLIHINEERKKI